MNKTYTIQMEEDRNGVWWFRVIVRGTNGNPHWEDTERYEYHKEALERREELLDG